MSHPLPVYLEIGSKRVFAGALDWPGWSRSGRDEGSALDALLAYRQRYATVVARAGLPFPDAVPEFEIVERLTGNATTDFGAPGVPPAADHSALTGTELQRQIDLLVACWGTLDEVVTHTRTAGTALRTGPRGGGRDLAKIESHVLEAEQAYLRGLGARSPRTGGAAAQREAALAALSARALGLAVENPSGVQRPWSPRYFVRRAAWHVLDHAWEVEDRSELP